MCRALADAASEPDVQDEADATQDSQPVVDDHGSNETGSESSDCAGPMWDNASWLRFQNLRLVHH